MPDNRPIKHPPKTKREQLEIRRADAVAEIHRQLGIIKDIDLKIFRIEHGLPFTVLTKGGMRAVRDFDLLEGYPKARFGTTLIFYKQEDANHWEPGAASIESRIDAIQEAHEAGIKTWVSMEPVIDPEQALHLAFLLHKHVDSWKVGKLNYNPDVEHSVDWIRFRKDIKTRFAVLGITDYYLKRSLTELPGVQG